MIFDSYVSRRSWSGSGGREMKIEGKVAVITGAASGIGRAIARKLKAEGAAGIAVADLQEEAFQLLRSSVGLP